MSHEDDARREVEFAFDTIKTAATLLSVFPYAKAAESLRHQEDINWFTNPTLMRDHDPDNLRFKLRLLDAAANFIQEYNAIGVEFMRPQESTDG